MDTFGWPWGARPVFSRLFKSALASPARVKSSRERCSADGCLPSQPTPPHSPCSYSRPQAVNMVRSVLITAMPRCCASESSRSSGFLPRTNTMHHVHHVGGAHHLRGCSARSAARPGPSREEGVAHHVSTLPQAVYLPACSRPQGQKRRACSVSKFRNGHWSVARFRMAWGLFSYIIKQDFKKAHEQVA